MNAEPRTLKFRRKYKELLDASETWRPHWLDISEYFCPRAGRYLASETQDSNDGTAVHENILNGFALDALRTLAAGLQGGLTSPARPWFSISFADTELLEYEPVRMWCDRVRNQMLWTYAQSNFYGSIHSLYYELPCFGTAAMYMEEDFKTLVRFRPMTIGEYLIGLDSAYRPSMLYRKFDMTARQMVEAFGLEAVSQKVRDSVEKNGESKFFVYHCIHPNSGLADPSSPYESVYFEDAPDDQDKILRVKGYRTIPFVAPRWHVIGVDTYGQSPAMDALGDNKMLQKMEEKSLKALDKVVDPPMVAPTALKRKGGTIVPGTVNYLDVGQGQQSFAPAYQINPDINSVEMKIQQVEKRIERFFYNDLFLALLNETKRMTATEVAERHEEKLIMLGPVIERLESELLDPINERVFDILNNFGLIPPAPPEIAGMEFQIQYISTLSQAQKLVGSDSIRRVYEFAGAIAQITPDVVDKLDSDQAVDEFAAAVGVTPKVVRSDDEVAKIRAAREEKRRQMEAAAAAVQMAESAKTLSQAPLDKNTALDKTMEAMGT